MLVPLQADVFGEVERSTLHGIHADSMMNPMNAVYEAKERDIVKERSVRFFPIFQVTCPQTRGALQTWGLHLVNACRRRGI